MDRNIYSPAITKQLNLHSIRSQANIRPTLLAMMRTLAIVVLIALLGETTAVFSQTYSMYVANESDDTVMLIQFDGKELSILETVTVGTIHTEIEGPHGLAVDLDGKHWFVSIAHGQPFGKVVRYSTTDNRPTGTVTLGMFPASMAVSSQTGLLYVANFNLHGNPEPSSIS
ncbi:MAG: YncE family protein, partial [Rhodothermaceae bacterium]|nr:YncE family protein [Rhodothermaceae bacterium]